MRAGIQIKKAMPFNMASPGTREKQLLFGLARCSSFCLTSTIKGREQSLVLSPPVPTSIITARARDDGLQVTSDRADRARSDGIAVRGTAVEFPAVAVAFGEYLVVRAQFLVILKLHPDRPGDLINVVLVGRRHVPARRLFARFFGLLPVGIYVAGGQHGAD